MCLKLNLDSVHKSLENSLTIFYPQKNTLNSYCTYITQVKLLVKILQKKIVIFFCLLITLLLNHTSPPRGTVVSPKIISENKTRYF